MSLGKKSKIFIVVSLTILIIVFVISPISYLVINGFITKNEYSRVNQPDYYIVPVERKIADIENQTQDNVKVNYANLEINLPCKKIIERRDGSISNESFFLIDKGTGKGIAIRIPIISPLKDKCGKGTSFETYSKMLYLTPDQINFFSITKNNCDKYFLLTSKPTYIFHLGSIYKFETSNVKGFQLVDPDKKKKNNRVEVRIFDKNDNQYELVFFAFSQREIDYTLASIRFKQE